MEVARVEPKRRRRGTPGKRHVEVPASAGTQAAVAAISAQCATTGENLPADISPAAMASAICLYGSDLDIDHRSLCEALHCSQSTLERIIHSDRWRDEYEAARHRRGQLFEKTGREAAFTPYDKIIAGEEVSPVLVKAAALKSNYCSMMAKTCDPEMGGDRAQGAGSVTIQVNTGIALKI